MTEENNQKEESLALWEVFQGVFAMFIGVQSEKNRERQNILLIVKFALSWAGV
jgi:hypothetical protein